MRGADWKFTKRVPDDDDNDAQNNARREFFRRPLDYVSPDAAPVHAFDAGFARGQAWGEAKRRASLLDGLAPDDPRFGLHAHLADAREHFDALVKHVEQRDLARAARLLPPLLSDLGSVAARLFAIANEE